MLTKIEVMNLNSKLDSESSKQSLREMKDKDKYSKLEANKLAEEVARLKEKWLHPKEKDKLMEQIEKHKAEIKALREDLSRKRDMIDILRAEKNDALRNVQDKEESVESEKLRDDRVSKLKAECGRKDRSIATLRASLETIKEEQLF